MPLHIVEYVAGARGCPILLKGSLNQDITWDLFEDDVQSLEIPDGYVYTTKNPVIDFDFLPISRMASDRFVAICRRFDVDLRAVPVEMVSTSGKRAAKDYFLTIWGRWASVIDLDRSVCELVPPPRPDLAPPKPARPDLISLESVEKFVVDESAVPPDAAFMTTDVGSGALVCTDEFRRACEDAQLVGLRFTLLTDYTKADFWS